MACLGTSLTAPIGAQVGHVGARSPGVVRLRVQGSVYSLQFQGDETIEYRIDAGHPDVRRGLLRIEEASSQSLPMVRGGASFRRADGTVLTPEQLKFFSRLVSHGVQGDAVVLDYIDSADGTHRRRHTLRMIGKTLRVRVQDLDSNTDYFKNYCGFLGGPTGDTPSAQIVTMQGALGTPIVSFEKHTEIFFLAQQLDLSQSHASDWFMPQAIDVVAGPKSIEFGASTHLQYSALNDGSLAAGLDETLDLVVSRHLADVLVEPAWSASPYRELLTGRTTVLLGIDSGPLADMERLLDLFDSWGIDDLAVYLMGNWCAADPDPPMSINGGPDWWPPADPSGMRHLFDRARSRGLLIGAYTAFNLMPFTAPPRIYDATQIAFWPNKSPKTSLQSGMPLLAEGAVLAHAERETQELAQGLGANLAFIDVSTYATPTRGADGDHIDQRGDSPWAKTLREAVEARRGWLARVGEIVKGPVLGEGSIATQNGNFEWLWSGAVDSVQRTINTGSGKPAYKLASGDPRAPTRWPVIPEFELRVMARLQSNHGNGFPERFFSVDDLELPNETTQIGPPMPLPARLVDRYRAYELSFGHGAYLQLTGPYDGAGNTMTFVELIKEHYFVSALAEHALVSSIDTILYGIEGEFLTFEGHLRRGRKLEAFRDPLLVLTFRDGFELFVNHGRLPWSVMVRGVSVELPEDGFAAHQTGTELLAFSGIIPTLGTARFDYAYVPGRWEILDGRGSISAFGAQDTTGFKGLALSNFARGIDLLQTAPSQIRVIREMPPTLTSLTISPAVVTIPQGQRRSLRAQAHFANGAFRDVTTMMQWTSSNPALATVDSGACLSAHGPGSLLIGGSFSGMQATPTIVDVQIKQ